MEDFKSIVDAYYPILYKIGRSFTRDPADFEDLYQEMLIQIYHSLKNYRKEAKLSTWIYRVCLNTAMTYNRKHKKKPGEMQTDHLHQTEGEYSGKEAREKEERIELLYESINELKKDDRAIILLHLEGNKSDEISEILGISATNARVRFMRIKKRLEKKMKEKGYEYI